MCVFAAAVYDWGQSEAWGQDPLIMEYVTRILKNIKIVRKSSYYGIFGPFRKSVRSSAFQK